MEIYWCNERIGPGGKAPDIGQWKNNTKLFWAQIFMIANQSWMLLCLFLGTNGCQMEYGRVSNGVGKHNSS